MEEALAGSLLVGIVLWVSRVGGGSLCVEVLSVRSEGERVLVVWSSRKQRHIGGGMGRISRKSFDDRRFTE